MICLGTSPLDRLVACPDEPESHGIMIRPLMGPIGSGWRGDLNPAMVAQARTVPEDSGAKLSWCEASALDLPFGDGEFDTVICQQGLQFFPDPSAGVREMARVGRAGGRIGVTVRP